jgi:hypothetical protein
MKSIFILYMPGHAGNFLVRLFSLSPETIPQLPKSMMGAGIPTELDRLALYRFSHVADQYITWQQFHRSWPDFIDKDAFALLNINSGFEYTTVVYGIHPHEFTLSKNQIYNDSDQIFHVELDIDQHGAWVYSQEQKLRFVVRENEEDQFQHIISSCNTKPISLTKMLIDNKNFLTEYEKICAEMHITANSNDALSLYNDWRSIRYPK